MPFSLPEKAKLLAVPYVGEKVIQRLEEIGLDSFEKLAKADTASVTRHISSSLGTTCWQNSPQARAAICNAINTAKADTNMPK